MLVRFILFYTVAAFFDDWDDEENLSRDCYPMTQRDIEEKFPEFNLKTLREEMNYLQYFRNLCGGTPFRRSSALGSLESLLAHKQFDKVWDEEDCIFKAKDWRTIIKRLCTKKTLPNNSKWPMVFFGKRTMTEQPRPLSEVLSSENERKRKRSGISKIAGTSSSSHFDANIDNHLADLSFIESSESRRNSLRKRPATSPKKTPARKLRKSKRKSTFDLRRRNLLREQENDEEEKIETNVVRKQICESNDLFKKEKNPYLNEERDRRGQSKATYNYRLDRIFLVALLNGKNPKAAYERVEAIAENTPCLDNPDIPSLSFITKAQGSLRYIRLRHLEHFVNTARILTLHLDGSADNRAISIMAIGLSNELGEFYLAEFIQSTGGKAQQIADAVFDYINSLDVSGTIYKKIRYISSDMCRSQLAANSIIISTIARFYDNKRIQTAVCLMHSVSNFDYYSNAYQKTSGEKMNGDSDLELNELVLPGDLPNEHGYHDPNEDKSTKSASIGYKAHTAIMILFGGRVVQRQSKNDIRKSMDAIFLRDFGRVKKPFATNIGSRFGIRPKNFQSLMIYSYIVEEGCRAWKERNKYANYIVEHLYDSPMRNKNLIQMSVPNLFWYGIIYDFYNVIRVKNLKYAKVLDAFENFEKKMNSIQKSKNAFTCIFKLAKKSKNDEAVEENLALQNFNQYIESFTEEDLDYAHKEIMAAHSAIHKKFKNDYGKWKDLKLSKSAVVVPNNIQLESSFSRLKQIQSNDATSLPIRTYRRAAAAQSGTAVWLLKQIPEVQKEIILKGMREVAEVNEEDSELTKQAKMSYLPQPDP